MKQKGVSDKEGMIQAAQVFAYVGLFTIFISNGEAMFPNLNRTFGPLMMITLFCFSVLACGLMVFYKPYMLFVDKKGKDAMQLVLYTTKWLGIFALLTIIFVAMLSQG